jgi:hypothetical protein
MSASMWWNLLPSQSAWKTQCARIGELVAD